MLKSDPPIVVEQSFLATVEEIWAALTEPDRMRQWFFEVMPDFKAEPGFKTEFHLSNEGRDFPHLWEVVEVVPNEKLVVNWKFGGYPGSSNVIFEVIKGENENIVRVTTEVLEDHPQDIPEFQRESGVGGWQYFINGQLKDFLQA
jgi:uncharacterized protein YndB with AHSA1/START domain